MVFSARQKRQTERMYSYHKIVNHLRSNVRVTAETKRKASIRNRLTFCHLFKKQKKY